MDNITGDLEIMSLPEIMQWAELNNKTGTLTISHDSITKKFYLQKGKIIFVSSQKRGERLAEVLILKSKLDKGLITQAINESQKLEIPFIGYLISEGNTSKEIVRAALQQCAEMALTDSFKWDTGTFEFKRNIPSIILNSPVKIRTSSVLLDSARQLDEDQKDKLPDTRKLANQLAKKIATGNVELPLLPDIMIKLQDTLKKEDASIKDVANIITVDQILTTKILKVANSAFFGLPTRITSLKQAIVYIGPKTVTSIVSVHVLTNMNKNVANSEKVKEILQHSLLCGYIAKKIAPDVGLDPDEAFVCGLLHDIGKTAIINILTKSDLPRAAYDQFIKRYHSAIGFKLAQKWKFSDVVKDVIRFHHVPQKAESNQRSVETIYLSDTIITDPEKLDNISDDLQCINVDRIGLGPLIDKLDSLREAVSTLI